MKKHAFIYLFILFILFPLSINAEINPLLPLIGDKTVNVTIADLNSAFKEGNKETVDAILKDKHRIENLIKKLYLTKKLALEAKQLKLDKDPLYQARVARFKNRLLLAKRLEALNKEPIEDLTDAAKEEYLGFPKKYTQDPQVDISWIKINVYNDRMEMLKAPADAYALVQEIQGELKKGTSFSDLALKYSDDPSKFVNQGHIGRVKKGQYPKAFDSVVFDLSKKDEISTPIRTKKGYILVQLHEYIAGKPKTFAEVKEDIIALLEAEYKKNRQEQHIKSLTESKDLSYYSDNIDAFIQSKK